MYKIKIKKRYKNANDKKHWNPWGSTHTHTHTHTHTGNLKTEKIKYIKATQINL